MAAVAANRQTLVELLDSNDYRLVEAGDGPEGLKHASRVTARPRSSGRHDAGKRVVVLTVSDDGVALAPEQLERVGQPHFQSEKRFTGEVPVRGLGLASVASLAWQAGGSLRVHNRNGRTAIQVEIRLPMAR